MFVLQLTQSIKPAKLTKDDLKSIPRTQKGVYSDFEHRLLSTYSPYRYSGVPVDAANRYALIEANQLLFDLLVKIDYSAAARVNEKHPAISDYDRVLENENNGLVAEKMKLLGPLLSQLGLPPNVPNSDSLDIIWKLKRTGSLALKSVIRLLGLDSIPDIFRAPDSKKIKTDAYSVEALHNASYMLTTHFKHYYEDCKLFLVGSFAHNHQQQILPSAIDFRVLIPILPRENYITHMEFAHGLLDSPISIYYDGRKTSVPITFMLVERDYFKSFALSDPANLFAPGNSLLMSWGCALPELPTGVRDELKLAGMFSSVVSLRESLTDVRAYQNPARLKAKRNAPYYAHLSLGHIFGPVDSLGGIKKFNAQHFDLPGVMGALIEANLQMQDVLLAYSEPLEKNIAGGRI